MSDEKTIRFAEQPLFETTKRGQQYRTKEYWVELSFEDGKHIVAWGDERGVLDSEEFDDISDAEDLYERKLDYYDIVEE